MLLLCHPLFCSSCSLLDNIYNHFYFSPGEQDAQKLNEQIDVLESVCFYFIDFYFIFAILFLIVFFYYTDNDRLVSKISRRLETKWK